MALFQKKNPQKVCQFQKKHYLCIRIQGNAPKKAEFSCKPRAKESSLIFAEAQPKIPNLRSRCGHSSVGRAHPCQGWGRGSESRFPLHLLNKKETCRKWSAWIKCPGGGIGRRARFRCVCREACRFESCSGHSFLFSIIYCWRGGGIGRRATLRG